MTLQEIALVLAISTPVAAGMGTGAKLYGDANWWVSAADYNTTELEKVQNEKSLLEFDKQNGTLTPRGALELQQLKDREKRLLLKLQ